MLYLFSKGMGSEHEMKGTIVSKKVKAGIVAATLIVLSAVGFVVTNVIAEDPPSTVDINVEELPGLWFISEAVALSNMAMGDDVSGKVAVGNITVYLDATDNYAGVNITLYSITFTPPSSEVSSRTFWTEYTSPFTLSAPGNYTISYYSVDNVNNIEDTKTNSTAIYADTIPPITICMLRGQLK